MKFEDRKLPSGSEIFSPKGLRSLLSYVADLGPVFPLCERYSKTGVILRHDIDLDLEPAFKVCAVERELGLRSSIFVMTTSETYNPFVSWASNQLRALADEGFEIGLHFDANASNTADPIVLERDAKSQAGMLESIIGREVKSLSLHAPSIDNSFPCVSGFINAYNPEIFSKDLYLSDSRRCFLRDPFEFISSRKDKTVQLLLHPMHYEGLDYDQIMCRQIRRYASRVDRAFMVNSRFREFYPFGIESVIIDVLPSDEDDSEQI